MHKLSQLILVGALCIGFDSVAFAQLELSHGPAGILEPGVEVKKVGGRYLVRSPGPLAAISGELILAETEAANIEFSVTNQNREPVNFQKIPPAGIFVSTPGKLWVEVTAIDFSKNIYGRQTIVVEVGSGPNPPDPGPTPPNPPNPPVPDVVPDKYGVGKVAFTLAPRDVATVTKYAGIYTQAADFLFGIPTLKFVTSVDDSRNNNPDSSVFAWLRQQSATVQCTDQQSCQQWEAWRTAISQALLESQRKRQFTRQDWFNALNEISQALRLVK